MASVFRHPATLKYDPVQLIGRVVGILDGGLYEVDCEGRHWTAARAVSCLLCPAVGDTVMIAGPEPGRVYLIAVIAQADASISRIETDGAMVLASRSGDVAVQADGALSLKGGRSLEIGTPSMVVRAEAARLAVREMDYLGKRANCAIGNVSLLTTLIETMSDRISQVARSLFRVARETDQVRAGHIDYQAGSTARLHADNMMVTGKHLVKVDAEQIHMG